MASLVSGSYGYSLPADLSRKIQMVGNVNLRPYRTLTVLAFRPQRELQGFKTIFFLINYFLVDYFRMNSKASGN